MMARRSSSSSPAARRVICRNVSVRSIAEAYDGRATEPARCSHHRTPPQPRRRPRCVRRSQECRRTRSHSLHPNSVPNCLNPVDRFRHPMPSSGGRTRGECARCSAGTRSMRRPSCYARTARCGPSPAAEAGQPRDPALSDPPHSYEAPGTLRSKKRCVTSRSKSSSCGCRWRVTNRERPTTTNDPARKVGCASASR